MTLLERLHQRREQLRQQRTAGETKGSIVFWYYAISLAIQLIRLWRSK